VNYRDRDAAAAIREIAPDGVDLIVEVSPAGNNEVDLAVARNGATIAIYAADGRDTFPVPVSRTFALNLRYQFLLLYTLDSGHLAAAVQDVTAAISAGAPRAGEEAGFPCTTILLPKLRWRTTPSSEARLARSSSTSPEITGRPGGLPEQATTRR
jgi:NADPH2:quinone reductase